MKRTLRKFFPKDPAQEGEASISAPDLTRKLTATSLWYLTESLLVQSQVAGFPYNETLHEKLETLRPVGLGSDTTPALLPQESNDSWRQLLRQYRDDHAQYPSLGPPKMDNTISVIDAVLKGGVPKSEDLAEATAALFLSLGRCTTSVYGDKRMLGLANTLALLALECGSLSKALEDQQSRESLLAQILEPNDKICAAFLAYKRSRNESLTAQVDLPNPLSDDDVRSLLETVQSFAKSMLKTSGPA